MRKMAMKKAVLLAGVAGLVLGAVLFIYALAKPRGEVITPGPVEKTRLTTDPDHVAAE